MFDPGGLVDQPQALAVRADLISRGLPCTGEERRLFFSQ